MTIKWHSPREINGRWKVDAHAVSQTQYDMILNHPLTTLSYWQRDAGYCQLTFEPASIPQWGGVDYCLDMLKEDVLEAHELKALDKRGELRWRDMTVKLHVAWEVALDRALGVTDTDAFNDIDASGWRGDEDGFDEYGRTA